MFDIGFSELIVIGLVALVVLGPERLPKVARTAGHLLGRLQRYVADVKADINREIQLEELRKLQSEMEQSARSIETSVNEELRSVETSLNNAIAPPAAEEAPAPARDVPAAVEAPEPRNDAQLELGFDGQPQRKAG
ncbi:MAG: Sec-independent protein translocase protein TatB [Pseudomonadota bacterium]|jgi:sec-independent protein translocase protein TatB